MINQFYDGHTYKKEEQIVLFILTRWLRARLDKIIN